MMQGADVTLLDANCYPYMYYVTKYISISITHSDHTDLVGFLPGGRARGMGLLSYSGCVEMQSAGGFFAIGMTAQWSAGPTVFF